MKKENAVTLLLSTAGGLTFALGMCMCLIEEWNAFRSGVIVSVIGAVILLVMVLVRRKMQHKAPIQWNLKTVGIVLVGIIGALVLGLGMVMSVKWNMMIQGIVIGIVGILMLISLIPMVKGVQ